MIDAAIAERTSQHDLEHVLQVLEQAEVPSSKVYTAADIHQDPHFRARDMIQQHLLPDSQPIDLPGIVPKLSATPGQTNWVGPALGQHTDEVLTSIGRSPEQIELLRQQGVI
jgi:crotonobetainyl-CoA:carnitine CoA-transferase CaiB-like acyl-CoA transferase